MFLGKELGARTEDRSCYHERKVQYGRLAQTELFRHGLDRVQEGAKKYRIVLMCAEKDPLVLSPHDSGRTPSCDLGP